MAKSKFYAIYVRVSSDDQVRPEGSLVSQVQRAKEYLRRQFGDCVFKVYEDEGLSAKDTRRPAYQQLISDIAQGLVSAIICTEISRLSRSEIDFLNFFELCQKHNVEMISLRENFDTTTAAGRLVLRQFASFAQYEREQISERTSANMQARARRGLWNGGFLYGYLPRPNQSGYLDIVESEAVIVRLIFDKYLEFGSYVAVADWLNASGYRTRAFTSKRGTLHPAKLWPKNTILKILTNTAYIAKRVVNGETINYVWQPIITDETFEQVQKLLDKNRVRKHNPKSSEHIYLLSGLLHCSHCDLPMESGSGTGRTRIYYYYRHPAKRRKKDCPCPIALPAGKIETLLCQELLLLLDDASIIESACQKVCALAKADLDKIQAEISNLDRQIIQNSAGAQSLIERIPMLTSAQVIEFVQPKLDDMLVQKKALTERRQELNAELLRLKDIVIEPASVASMLKVVLTEADELDDMEKKKLFEMVFAKIEVFVDSLQVGIRVYKTFDVMKVVRVTPDWLPETVSSRTVFLWRKIAVNTCCDFSYANAA